MWSVIYLLRALATPNRSGVAFKSCLLEAVKFPFHYCLVIFSDTFFFFFSLGFAIRNKTAFSGACERSFAKLFLLFIKMYLRRCFGCAVRSSLEVCLLTARRMFHFGECLPSDVALELLGMKIQSTRDCALKVVSL